VNSLSRIIRYLFVAILVGGILSLLRSRPRSFARQGSRRPRVARRPVHLFRDPHCGTFVSPEVSIQATQAGRVEHFCSEQCRDRYLSSERQAAGATRQQA
jgi:YHS domain-containing protein